MVFPPEPLSKLPFARDLILVEISMRLAQFLSLSVLSVALSACGMMKVQELGLLNISPTDYRSYLATRYQTMVRFEAEEMYDHIDATHFARKALGVLSGDVEPLPEEPTDWRLGKPFLEKITNAHARLRSALRLQTDKIEPEDTAEAVAAFDCWVEQAEEKWQIQHIKVCEDRFHEAIGQIQQKLGIEIKDDEAIKKITIYFDTDSSSVSAEDAAFLFAQVSQLVKPRMAKLIVEGHADRVGTELYNEGLSLRRAIAVHRIITSNGMDRRQVGVGGRGEVMNSVPTVNEQPEPKNRRAEIQIRWTLH